MNISTVSIITVNYNQTDLTCAMLKSIQAQGFRNLEVIVVDNASTENPGPIIRRDFPDTIFIRSDQNLGFAGGNNLGIRQAKGDLLFFVNNDTELTYFCIDRLVKFIRERPDCGAVSPLICYYKEDEPGEMIQYAGMTAVSPLTARNKIIGERQIDAGQFLEPQPTAYTHGAAMMVPRQVIETAGPMSEAFFLYYEELDWCERIRKNGYTIWVAPSARIYHKESASIGSDSPLKTYFLTRNRMIFIFRNFPSTKILFFFYIWLVFWPKSLFKYLFKWDIPNLIAVKQALMWFFMRIPNKYEKMIPRK